MESLNILEFQEKPYWHVNNVNPTIEQAVLPSSSDVAVVGAGFTGLAVALHLLKAGKSVVLFDAMEIGFGASGKNGGMVGPSLHKLGLDGLTDRYGRNKAMEILQEGMNAISYFNSFIAEENIDCDLKLTGRFRGVTNNKSLEKVVRDSEKLLALDGFKFDVINKANVHSEIGSDIYQGGVVYHQDGGLDPFKLQIALLNKVMATGGKVFENTRVVEIAKSSHGYAVETSKGIVKTGNVVIASNGYTKKFANNHSQYFSRRLLPITSAMIATEELPYSEIDRMFPKKRMHGGNHRLVQYYRASPDHKRVLFGARGTDANDCPIRNGKSLKQHLCKIFPNMNAVKIEYSWSGKVAYTFDHAPHLGKHDGLYYAIGYCGSGVTRSIYLAYKLANKILGKEDCRTAFDDLPFETKPFYNGSPWFMPAILKWHSFLDRVEGN